MTAGPPVFFHHLKHHQTTRYDKRVLTSPYVKREGRPVITDIMENETLIFTVA